MIMRYKGLRDHTFFRVFWGEPENTKLLMKEIERLVIRNKFEAIRKTPVLVCGKDNVDRLSRLGFECRLIHNDPNGVHDGKWFFNKFFAFESALSYYESATLLDFDCVQVREMPPNFLAMHKTGQSIQAPLIRYNRRRARWRKNWRQSKNSRILPCACYLHIRKGEAMEHIKATVDETVAKADEIMFYGDEIILAMVIDDMMKGWKGAEEYAKMGFAPPLVSSVCDDGKCCIAHFHRQGMVSKAIRKKPDWLSETPVI